LRKTVIGAVTPSSIDATGRCIVGPAAMADEEEEEEEEEEDDDDDDDDDEG